MPTIENPENYTQCYNPKSKFWVLLKEGEKGFISRSKEPFENVPINDKSNHPGKIESEASPENETTESKQTQQQSKSWASVFGM